MTRNGASPGPEAFVGTALSPTALKEQLQHTPRPRALTQGTAIQERERGVGRTRRRLPSRTWQLTPSPQTPQGSAPPAHGSSIRPSTETEGEMAQGAAAAQEAVPDPPRPAARPDIGTVPRAEFFLWLVEYPQAATLLNYLKTT
ncbi:histone acetyltransferase p300-like [Calypte anna]|uniref:histone acetyltransferase p300-like n=1 Tax=Calypte anna TaxID=9244 RepID=UPI0011C3620C|nr:histone acetyltransferase p300-like [Calypte anna]